MANVDLIRDALQQVEDQSTQLSSLLEVLDSVGGDNLPPWVSLMQSRIGPLDDAIQHLVCNLNKHVLPILADMSLNRGMGGMPPMVTKVSACQSTPTRM